MILHVRDLEGRRLDGSGSVWIINRATWQIKIYRDLQVSFVFIIFHIKRSRKPSTPVNNRPLPAI